MISQSPLQTVVALRLGPVAISEAVITTWGVIVGLALLSWAATRRLSVDRPGRIQALAEIVVGAIEDDIRSVARRDPGSFVGLIATLFLFIAVANLIAVIPGVHPPTARIETTGALAVTVFVSVHFLGIRSRGLAAYLGGFAKPAVVMLPLNIISEVTRTVSLMVRLFGNIMSGEFIIAVVVVLAGLFVPIPFMALHIVVGLIQAYIFAVLATVFIAAAMGDGETPLEENRRMQQ